MSVKRICFVVPGYPQKGESAWAFIRPTICAIRDLDIECSVISPQSVTNILLKKRKYHPLRWIDITDNGNTIEIFQPCYLSCSKINLFGYRPNNTFKEYAISKSYKAAYPNSSPDIIYCHFWHSGVSAVRALSPKIPVVVVSGESRVNLSYDFSEKQVRQALSSIKGVIAVSSKNLKESYSLGLLKKNPRTIVIPNSYNRNDFYKGDKKEARKKLGLADNETIVAFVGTFNERKGVNRLIDAVKNIPNLKLLLVGSGQQLHDSNQIAFSGSVGHHQVVQYLNAADMFVLPTLAEGCCNAIIEAMACGLPIISSNLPFNDDLLSTDNSIRIDPTRLSEISDAIKRWINYPDERKSAGESSLMKTADMTIEKRAQKIMSFLELLNCDVRVTI